MDKKLIVIKLLAIFLFVFLAGNFIFPVYFNQGLDFLEKKTGVILPTIGQEFRLGPDLQGGALLVYQTIGLEKVPENERVSTMETLRGVIHRRIEHAGIINPLIRIQDNRLIIEMAGVFDIDKAKEKIGAAPFLEFKELRPEQELEKINNKIRKIEEIIGKPLTNESLVENFEKIIEIENWETAFRSPFQSTKLTGKYLKRAIPVSRDLRHSISIEFKGEGVALLEKITKKNLEKPLFIFLDGEQISAPIIRNIIRDGQAEITGGFTRKEIHELAENLNAGALPIRIDTNPISQQIIGPALGRTYLENSFKAGLLGFLSIILFLILFYKLSGLMAAISLIAYAILLLSIFNIFGVILTLATIAGIILSVGMAVDANILIFSRIKEEIKNDNNFEKAIDYGVKRAWTSIRDGNLTTLIIVFILYFSGIPFLESFALGLGLGIIISVFTAIVITQNLLKLFIKTKLEKSKLLI